MAVSGVSGFIGSQIAKDLIERGYYVHGTVRHDVPAKVSHLTRLPGAMERLQVFEADLSRQGSFDLAMAGCQFAMHVASPFSLRVIDPQKELVDPAVEGTLNFLRSCKKAGVRKVILTSSVAAITDEGRDGYVFTEKDFNDKSSISRLPYYYSKAEAEKAAWRYVEEEAPEMKLVVINPIIVVGPSLIPAVNESATFIESIVDGRFGGIVDFNWTFVDVRDVSESHIRAMESEKASGRYICAASEKSFHMKEVAQLISEMGYKVAQRDLTDPVASNLVKTFSHVFPGGQAGVYTRNHIGKEFVLSNEKIVKELGQTFRDPIASIRETIQSMAKWGHLCKEEYFALPAR